MIDQILSNKWAAPHLGKSIFRIAVQSRPRPERAILPA
jgi:hypothetical protein